MQGDTQQHTEVNWAESALLVWGVVAVTFLLSAFCLASLSLDGSYSLLKTLQDGAPFVAHHRWFDWVVQQPVLWMQPWIDHPTSLAVVHGLMCALAPLYSLGVCFGMLRGKFSRMRIWPVLGILLVPLPGQILLMAEINQALQLAWICFAFVWLGCPGRWVPATIIAALAIWCLHPVASPLFLYAAVTAVAFGFAEAPHRRRRLLIWAVVFAVASVFKLVETLLYADPYEHTHMQGAAWLNECSSGLRLTPFVLLIPVLLDAVLFVRKSSRPDAPSRQPWRSKFLWAAAFALGAMFAVDPGKWSAVINYRKFAFLAATLVAFLAAIDVWRHRGIANVALVKPANARPALIYPALLFALVLGGMSLTWKSLCGSLLAELTARRGIILHHQELSPRLRDTALNHWATTPLSLILQGWKPTKIYLWDRDLQLPNNSLRLCPSDEFHCEDRTFKLAWLTNVAHAVGAAEKKAALDK